MHQGIQRQTKTLAAIAIAFLAGWTAPIAAQSTAGGARSIMEPAIWQGSEPVHGTSTQASNPSAVQPAAGSVSHSTTNPLRLTLQPAPPVPPQGVQMAPGAAVQPAQPTPPLPPAEPTLSQPLLDGNAPVESLMPPVVDTDCVESGRRRGVQPYGGGHPWDWSWGCGGSPYRNGPGLCDNYKVGPRWHITVDGMVMSREDTDLDALVAAMPTSFPVGGTSGIAGTPTLEQFDHAPGGRLSAMSQLGRCRGWDIQAVYEGITEWESSVVYPILNYDPVFYPAPLPVQPPPPFPDGLEQRSLKYSTQLHSGEFNFFRYNKSEWRPFCGVRYIKLDDTITDFFDQEGQEPLPFDGGDPDVGQFLAVAETDRWHNLHIQNNLMGFQIGLLKDTFRVTERFQIEGDVNGGVYYNKVKFSNFQLVTTTQTIADDTATTEINESRVDFSEAAINDARTYDEISYVAEASITSVCRLNRCWSLRAGYQVLWITDVQLADSAFTGAANRTDDLLFHGWHAGIECRR